MTPNQKPCFAERRDTDVIHVCILAESHGGEHVCLCGQKWRVMLDAGKGITA